RDQRRRLVGRQALETLAPVAAAGVGHRGGEILEHRRGQNLHGAARAAPIDPPQRRHIATAGPERRNLVERFLGLYRRRREPPRQRRALVAMQRKETRIGNRPPRDGQTRPAFFVAPPRNAFERAIGGDVTALPRRAKQRRRRTVQQ